MQLNEEQKNALSKMLNGMNCFVTGVAGSGKSTLINEFRRQCNVPYVVLAPTGIAAVNVNGQTIHSFFQFSPSLLTIDALKLQKMYFYRRKMIQSVKTIIIDEISMVRADVFCAIDWRLRELAKGPNRQKPFGGKQIIVVGDFFQLSPVVTDPIELEFMNKNCGGTYAFQTDLWKKANFQICWLKTPHRQKGDEIFIDVLNCVRKGDLNVQCIKCESQDLSAIEVLNSKCLARKNSPAYEPIKLCTTNYEAQRINSAARAKLQSVAYHFNAEISGKFPESEYPTEHQLELMEGARVMVLCNKRFSDNTFLHANGDLGVIVKIENSNFPKVHVKLDKNGKTVVLEEYVWNKTAYKLERNSTTGQDELKQETIGTFMQIPLRLAYAITIHKSQGLTMDNVDLKLGSGCFAHGQLYTALSRCKSLDGLLLERRVFQDDLILDQKVIDFYKELEEKLKTEKQ